jgi:hypothetical protein
MVTTTETAAAVSEQVTTKEELDDLKRRLAELQGQNSQTPSGVALGGKPYGWQGDVDGLATFLEDLKQVLGRAPFRSS